MILTENFTLEEFEHSNTAEKYDLCNNVPDFETCENLFYLCKHILQPVRDKFGYLKVNSGFRSALLNSSRYLSGAKHSQHLKGEASDIAHSDLKSIFFFIKDELNFDQLIWEQGDNNQPAWIHVSFSRNVNRNQVLRIDNKNRTLKQINR